MAGGRQGVAECRGPCLSTPSPGAVWAQGHHRTVVLVAMAFTPPCPSPLLKAFLLFKASLMFMYSNSPIFTFLASGFVTC